MAEAYSITEVTADLADDNRLVVVQQNSHSCTESEWA